jgi:uncharacterized damage-inducible protein DinB
MKPMVRVETVLDSWRTIRQDTAEAVEDFAGSDLDYKPVPELSTFREIAMHILDAGSGLAGILLDGEENLASPQFRESLKKYASNLPAGVDAVTLAARLRTALDELAPRLGSQPPEFFDHVITRFDGTRVTRLEMLQFVKEHELTHRAQLFMYLRLNHIVPCTTRRRLAKQGGR